MFILCPDNIVVVADPGRNSVNVTWQPPVFSDNMGIPNIDVSHPNGSEFTIGNETVTYTATDRSLNSASCTFTVTVQGMLL